MLVLQIETKENIYTYIQTYYIYIYFNLEKKSQVQLDPFFMLGQILKGWYTVMFHQCLFVYIL